MKPVANVISSSSDILGGTPVFVGTRVPAATLLDCLEQGDSIDLFLYDFPTVKRQQVIAMLEAFRQELMECAVA